MKNMTIKSVIVFSLVVLITMGLNAQNRRGNGGPGNDGKFEHPGLNLSDEQKEQLKTLRTEHFKEMNPLRNKMQELKAGHRTLMSEDPVNLKEVNANIDEQTALMNKIQKLQTAHRVAVKDVLSDEQEMILSQRRVKGKPGDFHHRRPLGPCRQDGWN
jgi:Spy/CpxP family protein refolding chaperone